MYEVGMYGGSFNPLHQGHVRCIIEAANQCKELHIIISNGKNRNEIGIRIKYRWVYQITKHIGNVSLHILEDDSDSKENYTSEYWEDDSKKVKKMIGKKIDIVFCGDDYNEESFYAKCYPESKIHYFKRDEISSTKIRSNPYKYWDWISNVVRPYFIKKVLLIGGESVGKSTLTINLANYYNTNYIDEAGRELSEKSGNDELMLPEDFTEILLRHKINEIEMLQTSNKVLFVDTDCLITKFYLQFLETNEQERIENEQLADAINAINNFDLVLFLEPDVEFVQDGTRTEEIKKNREKYSNKIKSIFDEKNIKYHCITGNYQKRFLKAIELIDERIFKY